MPSQEVLLSIEELHKEMERMQPSVRQVEIVQDLMKRVSQLPKEYADLIGMVRKEDSAYKDQLSKELSTHAGNIRQQVTKLAKDGEDVIKNLMEQDKKLSSHDAALTTHSEGLRNYLDSMISMKIGERVDRLQQTSELKFDKLDSTTSSVQLGIQNIQGRLDILETNISNSIRTEAERTRSLMQELQAHTLNGQRQHRNFAIITWVMIVVAAALIMVIGK